MKRRSFLAAVAALPFFGVASAGQKHVIGVDPAWEKEPIDLIFVGEYPNGKWIKDPFIPVNLDNGPVTIGGLTFDTRVFHLTGDGSVSLVWGPDVKYDDYARVSYSNSFGHIIPLEDEVFNHGEFYTRVTKNAPDQRLEFYHITYKGKNNLFVRTFETTRRGDLVISKEAMEDILNWIPRS